MCARSVKSLYTMMGRKLLTYKNFRFNLLLALLLSLLKDSFFLGASFEEAHRGKKGVPSVFVELFSFVIQL